MSKLLKDDLTLDKEKFYSFVHQNDLREEAKITLIQVVKKMKKKSIKVSPKKVVTETKELNLSSDQMADELRKIKKNLNVNQQAFADMINEKAKKEGYEFSFKLTRGVLSTMINKSRKVKKEVYEVACKL